MAVSSCVKLLITILFISSLQLNVQSSAYSDERNDEFSRENIDVDVNEYNQTDDSVEGKPKDGNQKDRKFKHQYTTRPISPKFPKVDGDESYKSAVTPKSVDKSGAGNIFTNTNNYSRPAPKKSEDMKKFLLSSYRKSEDKRVPQETTTFFPPNSQPEVETSDKNANPPSMDNEKENVDGLEKTTYSTVGSLNSTQFVSSLTNITFSKSAPQNFRNTKEKSSKMAVDNFMIVAYDDSEIKQASPKTLSRSNTTSSMTINAFSNNSTTTEETTEIAKNETETSENHEKSYSKKSFYYDGAGFATKHQGCLSFLVLMQLFVIVFVRLLNIISE